MLLQVTVLPRAASGVQRGSQRWPRPQHVLVPSRGVRCTTTGRRLGLLHGVDDVACGGSGESVDDDGDDDDDGSDRTCPQHVLVPSCSVRCTTTGWLLGLLHGV